VAACRNELATCQLLLLFAAPLPHFVAMWAIHCFSVQHAKVAILNGGSAGTPARLLVEETQPACGWNLFTCAESEFNRMISELKCPLCGARYATDTLSISSAWSGGDVCGSQLAAEGAIHCSAEHPCPGIVQWCEEPEFVWPPWFRSALASRLLAAIGIAKQGASWRLLWEPPIVSFNGGFHNQ
jgi:hypothetical protein